MRGVWLNAFNLLELTSLEVNVWGQMRWTGRDKVKGSAAWRSKAKLELVDNVREHTVKAVGLNTDVNVNKLSSDSWTTSALYILLYNDENGSFQVKSLLFASSIVSVRFSRQLLLLSGLPLHCGSGHDLWGFNVMIAVPRCLWRSAVVV